MQNLSRSVVGGLALVCLAASGFGGQGHPGQDPKGAPAVPATTQVAVVDFVKVIEAYPKAVQEKKRLDDLRVEMVARLKAEEEKLKDLRLARDSFNPGTRERALKELEMDMALRQLNGMRQIYESDLNEQYDKFLAGTYDEIEVAIAQTAKARGVQLVLRTHRDTTSEDSIEIKSRLQDRRIVWYAANEIDLTPHVIRLLQVPLAAPAAGK